MILIVLLSLQKPVKPPLNKNANYQDVCPGLWIVEVNERNTYVFCRRVGGYVLYVESRNIFSLRAWNNDTKKVFLQRQNVAELFLCWRKWCLSFWAPHRCPSACHLIWTLGFLGTRWFVSTGCSSSGLNSRDTDVERQRWVGEGREIGEEIDGQTNQQTETERRREGGRIGLRKPELWLIPDRLLGAVYFPKRTPVQNNLLHSGTNLKSVLGSFVCLFVFKIYTSRKYLVKVDHKTNTH